MAALTCDIVTPVAKLFTGEAYMVVVPGVEGEMGFLIDHVPLVSQLADGVIRIQGEVNGKMKHFALQGGYVQVTGKKVIVLANRALPAEDIDAEAVRAQLSELQKELAGKTEEEAAKTTLAEDISWCNAQLKAVAA